MIARAALLAAPLLLPTLVWAAAFGGTWQGGWDDPEFRQHGSTTIHVDRAGRFSGPIDNDTLGLAGSVAGTIAPDGATTMRYSYDGGSTFGIARGVMRRNGNHLHGEVRFATPDGRSLGAGTFDLDLAGSTEI